MTAGEFDELRSATLADRLGADTEIFLLSVKNLQVEEERDRSTFFTADARPVSKWGEFVKALKTWGFEEKNNIEFPKKLMGRTFWWEEGKRPKGKYGDIKYLEPVEIPSPEELAELGIKPELSAKPAKAKAEEPEIAVDDTLILSFADGLSTKELIGEIKDLGVTDEKVISAAVRNLLNTGKMTFKGGKYSIAKA